MDRRSSLEWTGDWAGRLEICLEGFDLSFVNGCPVGLGCTRPRSQLSLHAARTMPQKKWTVADSKVDFRLHFGGRETAMQHSRDVNEVYTRPKTHPGACLAIPESSAIMNHRLDFPGSQLHLNTMAAEALRRLLGIRLRSLGASLVSRDEMGYISLSNSQYEIEPLTSF